VAVRVETEQALVVSDETGLENLELDLEPEPDGDPYDVYALALHKHVIRRNLRTVSEFSGRFAGGTAQDTCPCCGGEQPGWGRA
jgi:hypothetical protein